MESAAIRRRGDAKASIRTRGETPGPGRRIAFFGAALLILAWYVAAPTDGALRRAVGYALLIVTPAVAAVSCFAVAPGVREEGRTIWRFFGVACLTGIAGALLSMLAAIGWLEGAPVWLPLTAYLAFHPLFALGALRALDTVRDRGATVDIVLDAALILASALVLMLRYLLPPILSSPASPVLLVLLLMQLGALSSVFFASLLLLWKETALPPGVVHTLTGAVALFATGNILVGREVSGSALAPGGMLDLIWIGGWGSMLYSALGRKREVTEVSASSHTLDALPRVIVPAAALMLAVLALDGVRQPLHATTALALGLVASLLAVRSGRALGSAGERREQQRRLAHTRALVEVSHDLAGVTDLQRSLDLVSGWAAKLVDAPCSGIELLSPDGRLLEMSSIHNLPPEALRLAFPVETSFTGEVVRTGRPRATADAAADSDIDPRSVAFLGHSSIAAVPIRFRERILGVLFAAKAARPFASQDLEVLQALGEQAAIAIENARLFDQVRMLSITDPLTGLANRRQLERDLEREFAAARRGRKLTVVLFDLDHFKQYNDSHGHLAGDQLLESFGQILAAATRSMNLAVRFGGDEFLAVLADCDAESARLFAERVRERMVASTPDAGAISVSAGIAEYDPTVGSPEELIFRADEALYEAKRSRMPVRR